MRNLYLYTIALVCSSLQSTNIPSIQPYTNIMNTLQSLSHINCSEKIRLHLGCGQSHLPGYINIDFPLTKHTVQNSSGADVFADITTLSFPEKCIAEFRSHHVFEHFNRQQALALLCTWHYALQPNGILIIETPDIEASINILANPQYTYQQKQTVLRHVFGSHEASWAAHLDGWYEAKFQHILNTLGFEITTCKKDNYTILHNITIYANKKCSHTPHELAQKAKELLRENMVNTSKTETIIWQVWCNELDRLFTQCIIQEQ